MKVLLRIWETPLNVPVGEHRHAQGTEAFCGREQGRQCVLPVRF